MSDLTPDNTEGHEHLIDSESETPFVDPSPPELPPDVWRRSLAIALDPNADPHEELVPVTDGDDAYEDLPLVGDDALEVPRDDDDSRDHDPVGVPDPASSDDPGYPGYPEASPAGEDNPTDPW